MNRGQVMRWRKCLTVLSLLFLLLVPTGIHAESMDGAIGNGNSPGETTAEKNDKERQIPILRIFSRMRSSV